MATPNLTPTQDAILTELEKLTPPTLAEVERRLGLPRGSARKSMAWIEKKGLAVRRGKSWYSLRNQRSRPRRRRQPASSTAT